MPLQGRNAVSYFGIAGLGEAESLAAGRGTHAEGGPGRGAGAAEAEEGHMKTEGRHFPGIREGPGEKAVS